MAIQAIRFNKSNLTARVQHSRFGVVRDVEISGLKFKAGAKRSVFFFEKRISGKNAPAITITIGAFPAISVEEARQEARRLANLCERGIDPRKKETVEREQVITFQMVLDRFFAAKKEIRPRTFQKYREIVQHQFSPSWLSMDLRSVTADMIVQQFHVIRKTAPARAWDFLKVYMNVWNTCAPLFRDAKDQRLLKQSPIPEARNMLKNLPRHVPKRSVIPASLLGRFVLIVERLRSGELLMQDDVDRPPSPIEIRMCDIALLTLFTAFRFNEARCLKWEYIDLDNGVIRLPGDAGKGTSAFKGTKNRCDHHVPLSSYAWDLLRKIHGERLSANPYVFPAIYRASGPTSRNHTVFNRITVLLGTHYSPHTSRRTFASVADEAGLGFLTLKRLLNHTFQGGVTGGYIVAGFNPEKERANFQKVCDYILDRRAEFLGAAQKKEVHLDMKRSFQQLKRYAIELGFDPQQVIREIGTMDKGQVW